MNLIHLNYKIDKKKYSKIFYDIHQRGEWYQWKKFEPKLSWWKVYLSEDSDIRHLTKEVEEDLGIWGMNTYPRFAYLFANNNVPPHVDEDDMTSIQINLFEKQPVMVVEDKQMQEILLLDRLSGYLRVLIHWTAENHRSTCKFINAFLVENKALLQQATSIQLSICLNPVVLFVALGKAQLGALSLWACPE